MSRRKSPFVPEWLPGIGLMVAMQCAPGRVWAQDAYRNALVQAMAVKETAIDSQLDADWYAVLVRLQEVEAIRITADSKYEMAFAQARLGRHDQALESYELALELGLPWAAASRAAHFMEEHRPQMARVALRGADGARLFVRGIERGRLPLQKPVYVMAGECSVEVTELNGIRRGLVLSLEAGQLVTLPLEPSSPNPASSTLTAKTRGPRAENSTALRIDQPQVAPPWRTAGWLLLGAGTILGAIGGAFVPLSANRIARGRGILSSVCGKQVDGPDTCEHAKPNLHDQAQSAADSIETWKMARTTAWISTITGLVAAGAGGTILITRPQSQRRWASIRGIAIDPQQLVLTVEGGF